MPQQRPPRSDIKDVYSRDGYQCQNCHQKGGKKGPAKLNAHHIVPLKDGGSNNASNLKTLCKNCHDAIHTEKEAPTAKQKDSKFNGGAGEAVVLLSVLSAGEHPYKVMVGVGIVSIIGIVAGFMMETTFAVFCFIGFFLFSAVFVRIIRNAKSRGRDGVHES